jgi:hypothetical protein
MADTATFVLDLESNIAGVAQASAGALEQLKQKIQGDVAALREMQAAMRAIQSGGVVNIAVAKELRDRIAAQKATIAAAQSQYISLGGTFSGVRGGARETNEALQALAQAVGVAGGPLAGLLNKLATMRGLVGAGVIAGGILAIVAALAALAAASVSAAASLGAYALKQADARRSELLRLEGLTKVRRFMFGGFFGPRAADSAEFLQGTIDQVASKVAASRDEVAKLTSEFYRAGLRGGNLQQAVEGASIALSAGGEEAVAQFKAMAMGAGLMGGNLKRVADDARARFGRINDLMRLGLNVQFAKAKENIAALFKDIKIENFLKGLSGSLELLSQSTATGRALKAILETIFQPLMDQVSGPVGVAVKRFFQGMVIGALLAVIAFQRLAKEFNKAFGSGDFLKNLDLQKTALMAGVVAVGLLAAAFVGLGFAMAVVTAIGGTLVASIVAPFVLIVAAIENVRNKLKTMSWGEIARSWIDGLVNGILSGMQTVGRAVESLGNFVLSSFKRALDIKSPSRVAMRAAIEFPRGVALGIKSGSPEVERATQGMISIPNKILAEDSAKGALQAARGGVTLTIEQIIVNAQTSDPAALADKIGVEIERRFQAVAVHLGAAV